MAVLLSDVFPGIGGSKLETGTDKDRLCCSGRILLVVVWFRVDFKEPLPFLDRIICGGDFEMEVFSAAGTGEAASTAIIDAASFRSEIEGGFSLQVISLLLSMRSTELQSEFSAQHSSRSLLLYQKAIRSLNHFYYILSVSDTILKLTGINRWIDLSPIQVEHGGFPLQEM